MTFTLLGRGCKKLLLLWNKTVQLKMTQTPLAAEKLLLAGHTGSVRALKFTFTQPG